MATPLYIRLQAIRESLTFNWTRVLLPSGPTAIPVCGEWADQQYISVHSIRTYVAPRHMPFLSHYKFVILHTVVSKQGSIIIVFVYVLLCRLTAFVLSSFSEIAQFYGNGSFIDDGIMSAAFSYLSRNHKANGCFALKGRVHNRMLMVCCCGDCTYLIYQYMNNTLQWWSNHAWHALNCMRWHKEHACMQLQGTSMASTVAIVESERLYCD